jgi:hypothetical protein
MSSCFILIRSGTPLGLAHPLRVACLGEGVLDVGDPGAAPVLNEKGYRGTTAAGLRHPRQHNRVAEQGLGNGRK